jgi:UDP-N-acetylglucosamine--N-acetylmuramyl-(pentapeptide) pyrophosphoryl-undecaprenol N-acetylglucosamine transferase
MKNRVLIMAGGTGGHIFPALAVARAFQKEGIEVEWLGTKRGLEASIVPKAGIILHTLTVAGLRRAGWLSLALAPLRLCLALLQALRIMVMFKPNVVLGMGGFASGPGGIAAWLLRYPLVIHEQNAVAGVTNRILSRFAKKVLEGFPNSFSDNRHAIWTGNPVREELAGLPMPAERHGPLRILIMGGSQGAVALNQLCPEGLSLIPENNRPEVWHQTGNRQEEKTRKWYLEKGVNARVEAFIEEVSEAYAWADLVLCRAGALTVAELAMTGVASILVPFPFAADDHQTHNGRFLETIGAARVIPQTALDPLKLADIIIDMSSNRQALLKMANAARSAAKPDAVIKVVENCKEVWREFKKR